ncbi:bacterio-opsin activator domain-containing protein [Natrialbaceae archaeon A-gly3]
MEGADGNRDLDKDGGDRSVEGEPASVLLVAGDESSEGREVLEDDARFVVDRVVSDVSSADDLEEADCIVLEADRPNDVHETLTRVGEDGPPVVVTPTEGSERLATAALRSGAAEYVSHTSDEEITERLAATLSDGGMTADADARFQELLAGTLPDEAFLIDEDGYYLEATVRPEATDLYTETAEGLIGEHLSAVFPEEATDDLLACLEEAIETGDVQTIEYQYSRGNGVCQYEARVTPIDERIDGRRAVVWLARDITERARRERELRERRDQLETLNGINRVVHGVIRTLVEAPSRADIEREACEKLVESELYCGACIGEPDGGDDVVYRAGAGEATTFLEAVRDPDVEPQQPVLETLKTEETRTTNRLPEDPRISDRHHRAAREDGITSAIAVPAEHGDTVYGVLVAFSGREDAFTSREVDAFELLGETIGFAINAVMNRRLLFADSVIELEFRIEDGETFAFDLTETYDCSCHLEWAGDTADGQIYQYVAVEGLDGETAIEEANADESVEECRLIHDDGDRCTIELRLADSGIRSLTNHGATVREVMVEDGTATVLVEVPRDADVRAVVDALRTVYDDVSLIAHREVDRPVQTAEERRDRIADRLTDRQLTALRLAYYGGYFDWPRGSTGEEIAETMDVSPPTMHQHLRKAQGELLAEFFEDDG